MTRMTTVCLALALLWGCDTAGTGGVVSQRLFGEMPYGQTVDLYTLTNPGGVELQAITYGATIVSIRVPDRNGVLGDIVLGFDDLAGYLEDASYFGAVVGRYANRIARGRFSLDSETYELARNNGPNHLHGGVRGFDKVVWSAEAFATDSGVGVTFTHTSPDGDEGYPGTLAVQVTYTLTPDDALVVDYVATTDRPTPVNLSQHTYFNLTGDARRDVLDHVLTIDAERYTPVDSMLIPTGTLAAVAGTPFDFTAATPIGTRIDTENEQLRFGGGYDHNFVLARDGDGLMRAARLSEPTSGRVLEIYTTEPGLQFYSGNFLDGSTTGKNGHVYGHRFGLCLETQHFPDSPNQPEFPSTIVRPDDVYRSRTVFRFSTTPP